MITIDARWVNNSGMGTYLRHVIPGIIEAFPNKQICLLGNLSILTGFGWLDYPNVHLVNVGAEMYSAAEQWQIIRSVPPETELLFYPHYNIPLFYRGKMLVTVYDLCHLALPQLVNSALKTAYAKLFFHAVRIRADAVITISHFTKDEFVRHTSRRKQPVIPIHLGVNEDWFNAALLRDDARRDLREPYVLYVGNVKPHKNLGALVEAWRLLTDSVPHKLIVVGKREGLLTGDTKVQMTAVALGDRISFTGYVDDDALKRWVANADALVLPSLYEGFGLPPLEAMAAGCPVAVSDIPVFREICGDAAAYFDPHDPVQIAARLGELLLDRDLRSNLCARGFIRAREFRWNECIAHTCDVMRDLLSKN